MKNAVSLILILVLTCNFGYSQTKKTGTKNATKTSELASLDNLIVDVKAEKVVLIIKNKPNEESVTLSDQIINNSVKDVAIKSFSADNTKLYLVSWTEVSTNKTELKLEEITIIYNKIVNTETKAILFSNYQKINQITEKVFLDRLKNASETQQKIRREGFEFTLNADGSIAQKNKTQENKWSYSSKESKFIDVKRK